MKRNGEVLRALDDVGSVHLEDCCGEPQTISALLAEAAGARRGPALEVHTGLVLQAPPYRKAVAAGRIRLRTSMPGRGLARCQPLDYVPMDYNDHARAFREGRLAVDAVAVSVTPSGSLGIQYGYLLDAVEATLARGGLLLVERNARLPDVAGAPSLDLTDALVVDSALPPVELQTDRPDATQRAAAGNACSLIPSGACIEVGIGAVGNAVLAGLAEAGRRQLSFHSGMLGDGIVDFAATNPDVRSTPLDTPAFTASLLIGSHRLFEWAAGDSRVRLVATDAIHPPATTAAIPDFCAVNTALEVDLAGNAGAEVVGGRRRSGPGGQLDFALGASKAPGGRSIVVLTALSKSGHSRIVPRLSGPATTPASLVHFVATEHGVADLTGRGLEDRARALTAIAAPDVREKLAFDFAEALGEG